MKHRPDSACCATNWERHAPKNWATSHRAMGKIPCFSRLWGLWGSSKTIPKPYLCWERWNRQYHKNGFEDGMFLQHPAAKSPHCAPPSAILPRPPENCWWSGNVSDIMKGQGLIEPQMKIKPEEKEIRKRDKNFASHHQNEMVPRIAPTPNLWLP